MQIPLSITKNLALSLTPIFLGLGGLKAQETLSDLLRDREHLESTVWHEEVLAQQHEEYFIELWDSLRGKTSVLQAFENAVFDSITWSAASHTTELDHHIEIADGAPAVATLDHAEWIELLRNLNNDGWSLHQSEWHHKKFDLNEDGMARSVVSFALHVLHEGKDERVSLEGLLEVAWNQESDNGKGITPQTITVSSLEIQRRTGSPLFARAGSFEIEPGRRGPVLAHDLDQDGAPELILPGASLIAWNDGNAGFDVRYLNAAPIVNARAAILGDFDGNGTTDLIVDGSVRLAGTPAPTLGQFLFRGDPTGAFSEEPAMITIEPKIEILGDTTLTSGDVDGDGDLDLWLGQYKAPYLGGSMPTPFFDANDGNPSFLLINQGTGDHFKEVTESAGFVSKRHRRVFSSSLLDWDTDGDRDLLVVSDFSGVDLYENDGTGHFTDVTSTAIPNRFLFGMAHSFADFDYNGEIDFYTIGMSSTTASRLHEMGAGPEDLSNLTDMRIPMTFGNRLYLNQGDGSFAQPSFNPAVARTGWAWGVVTVDFDNDGDIDYYVANGHDSNTTAKDYCSSYWTDDIYRGSSNEIPLMMDYFGLKIDEKEERGISWNGFEHNFLMMPMRDGRIRNLSFLGGIALEDDSRMVLAEDLNRDGRLDLVVDHNPPNWDADADGNTLSIFLNNMTDVGNFIGLNFQRVPGGVELNGTRILVMFDGKKSVTLLANGDSFETQHSLTKHFGLGDVERVDEIVVTWVDGRETRVKNPQINHYHAVKAPHKP